MIDVEELKRTLKALSEALPLLPGRLSELEEGSESLREQLDEVARTLRDRQSEATKALEEADHALTSLKETAKEEDGRLEEASEGLGSAVREALSPLGFDAGSLVPAELVMRAVSEGPARLASAQQEAGEALLAVEGRLEDGQAALSAAVEALSQSEAVLVARLDAAQAELEDAVDGVMRLMESRQQDAERRIEEMSQAFAAAQSALKDKLDEVAETVCRARPEQALEETRTRVREIEERVVTLLRELEEALRGVGEEMAQTREGCAGDREALDALFQDLRARLEPMKRAIDSVREAAEEVGLAM